MLSATLRIAPWVLLLVTLFVYWPGLNGPLLFDDYVNTTLVRAESLEFNEVKDAALSNSSGRFGRPVANLTFAVTPELLGASNFSYKLTNLILHLISGVLVYWLALILSKALLRNPTKLQPQCIAVITAAFWLLHPIQVSTVLYVVQRMAQLSALFALLSTILFIRWRLGLREGTRTRTVIYLCGILTSSALSVLSKGNGALIPLYFLVAEFTIFGFDHVRRCRKEWLAGNLLISWLPLGAGILYAATHFTSLTAAYDVRSFSLFERLLTEVHALWHYLRLIFFPRLSEMGLYYDDFPIIREFSAFTVIGALALASLVVTAILLRRSHPILAFGILWYLAAHALESTFLPLEPAFEHRNYLALFGPAMVIGRYVPRLIAAAPNLRRAVVASMAAVAILLTGLTFARVHSWSSLTDFFITQSIYHPNSVRVKLDQIQHSMRAENWLVALGHIREIRKLAPDEPAGGLLPLFVTCNGGPYNPGWVDEARDALRSNGNYRMTISAFQALVAAKLKGTCEAVRTNTLIELIDVARSHPDVADEEGTRSLLALLKARLQVVDGLIGPAAETYLISYRAQPDRLTPLFELASLQIRVGDIEGAQQVLARIREEVEDSWFNIHETRLRELEKKLTQASATSEAAQN